MNEFLRLSHDDQMAAVEAMIFAADEPVTVKFLQQTLLGYVPEEIADEDEPIEEQTGQEENNPELTERTQIDDPSALALQEMRSEINSEEEIDDSETNILLDEEDIEASTVFDFPALIDEINRALLETGRPYQIIKIAGGYEFATRPEYGRLIANLDKSKARRRLSQAALETLAIVAYRQPVSKPEVEQIRGVNSNEVVNSLLEKGFVKIVGRKDVLGKPLLYGTTDDFLKIFGLDSLEALPKLRELEDIAGEELDMGPQAELTIEISDEDRLKHIPENMDHSFIIQQVTTDDMTAESAEDQEFTEQTQ